MNRQVRGMVVASVTGVACMVMGGSRVLADGQPESKQPPAKAEGQVADATTSDSLGTVVVERETLFKLDDDAFEHVSRARDSFRQRKPVEAAVHLRRAGWIFVLVEKAAGAMPPAVASRDIAAGFESLAHSCEHRSVDGDRDFDRRLLDLHVIMAGVMHERAHAAWSDRRERAAGYCLRSAARHVETAAEYGGITMDAALKPRVHGARVAGGKVVGDTGWTREEVEQGLAAIDDGLAWVNGKVLPRKESSEAPAPDVKPAGGSR